MIASVALALALLQDASALQAARNVGVAHYERGDYGLALEALEAVLESGSATARDAFNAGMAALQNQEVERALAHFTTARQMDPSLLEVDFGLGILYKRQLVHPRALEALERVAAGDPEDPCTWLSIGVVRQAMERVPEAERAFDRVIALGPARGKNFYVSALFRKATLLARRGERDRAKALFGDFEQLRSATPGEALTPAALENGAYGRVWSPTIRVDLPEAPSAVELAELEPIAAPRCEDDVSPAKPVAGDYDRDGLVDLFLASPCGGSLLYRNEGGGRLRDVTQASGLDAVGDAEGALFVDDEVTDGASLYVWSRGGARLFRLRAGAYVQETVASEIPREAVGAIPFDFDSDGQLDLFLFDGAVLRNDGDGTFTTLRAGVRAQGREAVAADFDADGFVDVLLALETGGALLFSNEGGRGLGRTPVPFGGRFLTALDVDGDGWLDVAGWEDGKLAVLGNAGGTLRRRGGASDVPLRPLGGGVVLNRERVETSLPNGLLEPALALDLEGEGRTTLVVPEDGRVRRFRETRPAPGWLRVALEGQRSNRAAVGAEVEVKAGLFYRKQVYRGLPLAFDTGGRDRVDVVRVTWTNGVVQNAIDVPTEAPLALEEDDRQTSSCPFLYVWDGERFRFLTDVVGRAPLGEITPGGGVVTPNPDDYVRIPPGAMQSRDDGRYVLQLTEELRELAFLDGVGLHAVDHPEDMEVFTDERFHGPPFESFRLHAVSGRRAPSGARNGAGEDVLDRVRALDGDYLVPPGHPVPGFAPVHALVLDVPPQDGPVALLLSGFVYWPSSSSMRAVAAHEAFAPMPPILQVEDGAGGWETLVADLGLPSGIDRTFVVELDDVPRKLRVVSNFAVFWDRAALARPFELAAPLLRPLPLVSADLHYRGFSAVAREPGGPERYDYDRLLSEPPWDGAPGRYTRFGDVEGLVREIDDRLVVMAPGDEMTLVFDGSLLPELREGYVRTFVLHVRGWAKDRDPNTRFSSSVEPLPVASGDPSASRRPSNLVPRLAPPKGREK